MDRSPESIWAELWKLSAQTMAVEIMLVSTDRGVKSGTPREPHVVASVLQDAANTAQMLAERGPVREYRSKRP